MNWLSYFLYLIGCGLICLIFYFIFKNRSKKTQTIAISTLLFIGFIVHFLKLLTPFYKENISNMWVHITFNTPCAATTILFPFLFFVKNEKVKDFIVVFGFISGLLTLLIPSEVMTLNPLNLEVFRFYFAHLVIMMSGLFTYLFKLHTLSSKWIKNTLIGSLLLILLVVVNDQILYSFGYEYLLNN